MSSRKTIANKCLEIRSIYRQEVSPSSPVRVHYNHHYTGCPSDDMLNNLLPGLENEWNKPCRMHAQMSATLSLIVIDILETNGSTVMCSVEKDKHHAATGIHTSGSNANMGTCCRQRWQNIALDSAKHLRNQILDSQQSSYTHQGLIRPGMDLKMEVRPFVVEDPSLRRRRRKGKAYMSRIRR